MHIEIGSNPGSVVTSSFKPAWWLPGPHVQTLFPFILGRHLPVSTRRERLTLPDGDFLDLDWAVEAPEKAPLVLILHGLEGSLRSHYAGGLMRSLNLAGLRAVLMHFRGCSGEPNRLARSYHSGETGDLDWVVRLLRRREPETALAAVGFSLGGNVLLKWLGETGAQADLQAAVAVSVPFDLAIAADRLEHGLSRLYQAYLLHKLRRSLRAKQARVELPFEVPNLGQLDSFRRFDHAVTAPLHGFAGVDDYYARASSRPFLSRIARPTLILQALDDPFMTPAIVPSPQELAPLVRLELSAKGGHVGFISGRPFHPEYWLEQRIPAYLGDQLRRN